ncbi:MAG: hypothetical protein LW688_00630 [Cryomorphaceae bacterium]|nr:hypothetical protein [Cryomorphaceae bacterium]
MSDRDETLIFELPTAESSQVNPSMLRIVLSEDFTRIDFGYTTPWYYEKGGWIKISPKTYLQVEGSKEKFILKEAVGIEIAPKRINFESIEDWQFFTLYFDPIPKKNCRLNMIEEEDPTPDDFNFYGIELRMDKGLTVLK